MKGKALKDRDLIKIRILEILEDAATSGHDKSEGKLSANGIRTQLITKLQTGSKKKGKKKPSYMSDDSLYSDLMFLCEVGLIKGKVNEVGIKPQRDFFITDAGKDALATVRERRETGECVFKVDLKKLKDSKKS